MQYNEKRQAESFFSTFLFMCLPLPSHFLLLLYFNSWYNSLGPFHLVLLLRGSGVGLGEGLTSGGF